MAAFIVASLLCLPSDAGQTSAADARPAAAAATTITAIADAAEVAVSAVAAAASTKTITEMMAMATTGKTSAAQFSVHMMLPFSKSTIRYSYTEPSGSPTKARIPVQTADVDQAHSMSVSPYGCGTAAGGDGVRCPRKRKRVRWKTSTAAVRTNTVMPLPGYPTAAGDRGVVFEAAADQLDRLYTVSRVDGAVSSSADDGEASGGGGEGDATDSDAEDVTAK